MDEGWTRWILEQYGFEFVILRPEDFHTPLRGKVDVIILADDARIPVESASGASRPEAAAAEPARAVRPEYAYALTADDLKAFEAFIRGGGTAGLLQRGLPVRRPAVQAAGQERRSEGLKGGGILPARIDRRSRSWIATHPVMAGMPEKAAVFVDGSPVFDLLEGFKGTVLAKYAETGSPLLSGYLIGEKYLNGKAAALDVELGLGHVVLLGFRPEWRAQSFGTFRVVFNAALYGK